MRKYNENIEIRPKRQGDKHQQNSVDKTPSSISNPPKPPVTPKKK